MDAKDCIFCKIAAGEITSVKIFEDDDVLAFLDIGPISDGHTLIIPKQHCETVDKCDPLILEKVASKLVVIAGAAKRAVGCDGYNVLCNNGRAAGQLVDHLHFHIIPRNDGDGIFDKWPSFEYPDGKAQAIAEKIKENL